MTFMLRGDCQSHVAAMWKPRTTAEVADIARLYAELKTTVAKIDRLRTGIDAIVAEIEGDAS